ncbi:dioxygenase [Alicyclobacillus sp. SO9]|uniref:dioxygenase family protein n=1 Tax=Alicyclobacillus sp. SO9 TaxID=2665646 RepID=UPI0018E7864F|nr:class III extradiol ring-cleavage dioxygenase [Alicyclobacillus sp. SO9]QQE78299.1 dioxygenase [Alicyclobacillus sp. SO9]
MIPSLFIAHGSPLLAIEDNEYTQFLQQLGHTLPRPKAIVLFSAHWVSGLQKVSEVAEYDTIYDFGGFPDELYQISYPAKGDLETARAVERLLDANNFASEVESQRGLDHGAWVILHHLFPEADIPVIAMSVNPRLSPSEQYRIGTSLAALRAKDVLVIGSGGTVHNLGALNWQANDADQWALEFDKWLEARLGDWNLKSLYAYESLAPSARLAVPPYGNEHFVPLFYAMGAADASRTAKLLHRSYQYGSLSQTVWQFG